MYKKSKFKVGDKVLTPIGVGVIYKEEEFDIYLDEWYIEVVIGERFGFNRVITFGVNDLKPYKTPHERLLELGWVSLNKANGVLTYLLNVDGSLHPERIELSLEGKRYYTTLRVIDLELAEILVDYLKELKNE